MIANNTALLLFLLLLPHLVFQIDLNVQGRDIIQAEAPYILETRGYEANIDETDSETSFAAFKQKKLSYEVSPEISQPHSLGNKLSQKLFYYITNGYNPNDRPMVLFRAPFVANPARIEAFNLTIYKTESVSLKLTLEETMDQVDVVDAFSSTDQVTVGYCSRSGLLRQSPCDNESLKLDSENQTANLTVRITPKRMGLSSFKLYVLCRINGKYLSVYTVSGSFVASRSLGFSVQPNLPVHLGVYQETVCYHLTINNRNSEAKNIVNIQADDDMIQVNGPTKFVNKQLESEWSLKKFSVEGVQVWSVNPNESKRFAEVLLSSQPEDHPQHASPGVYPKPFDFTEKHISRTTRAPPGEQKDVCNFLDRHVQAYETIPDCPRMMPEYPREFREPVWPHLTQSAVSFQVNRNSFTYNFLTHFQEKTNFWEQKSVNFGILCSRGISHEVSIYATNPRMVAVILKRWVLKNANPNFKVDLVRYMRHPTLFPPRTPKTLVAKLLVSFVNETVHFSVFNGWLVAKLDFAGTEQTEQLHITGGFSSGFFGVINDGRYDVDEMTLQQGIMIRQNIASHIFINQIEVKDAPTNDRQMVVENLFNSPSFSDFENFESEYTTRILEVKIRWPYAGITSFKNRFVVAAHSLENVLTFTLEFYYRTMICEDVDDFEGMFDQRLNITNRRVDWTVDRYTGQVSKDPEQAGQKGRYCNCHGCPACMPKFGDFGEDTWAAPQSKTDPVAAREGQTMNRVVKVERTIATVKRPRQVNCEPKIKFDFLIFSSSRRVQSRRVRVINNSISRQFIPKIDVGEPSPYYKFEVRVYYLAQNKSNDGNYTVAEVFSLDEEIKPVHDVNLIMESEAHMLVQVRVSFEWDHQRDPFVQQFLRTVKLYKNDGSFFELSYEFWFTWGGIGSAQPVYDVDLFVPGTAVRLPIDLTSTYPVDINITSVRTMGQAKKMALIQVDQPALLAGVGTGRVSLALSLHSLIGNRCDFTHADESSSDISLYNIYKSNEFESLYDLMKQRGALDSNLTLVVETTLNLTLYIPVRVHIKRAEVTSHITLNPVSDDGTQTGSLKLTNSYPFPIEVNLFAVPKSFVTVPSMHRGISEYHSTLPKYTPAENICFRSNLVNQLTLKYFVDYISQSVDGGPFTAVYHPYPGNDTAEVQSSLCFEIPSLEATRMQIKKHLYFARQPFVNVSIFGDEAVADPRYKIDLHRMVDIGAYTDIKPIPPAKQTFWEKVRMFVLGRKPEKRSEQPTIPSLTSQYVSSGVSNIYHIKNMTSYARNKRIYLTHPRQNSVVIPPGKTVVLRDAFLFEDPHNITAQANETVLLLKTNNSFTFVRPFNFTGSFFKLAVNYTNTEAVSSLDAIAYFKEVQMLGSNHIPMKWQFWIKNVGNGALVVRSAKLDEGSRSSRCFQLQKIKRRRLQPGGGFPLLVVVSLCEKANSGYSSAVSIETSVGNFTFPLRVRFVDFYVLGDSNPAIKRTLSTGLGLLLGVLVLVLGRTLSVWLEKWGRQEQVRIRGVDSAFLGTEMLADKLELYNHRVKAAMQKASPIDSLPHFWGSQATTPDQTQEIFFGAPVQEKKIKLRKPKPQKQRPLHPKFVSEESPLSLSVETTPVIDPEVEGQTEGEGQDNSRRFIALDGESRSDLQTSGYHDRSGVEGGSNFQLKKASKLPEPLINLNHVIMELQAGLQDDLGEIGDEQGKDAESVNQELQEEKSLQESLQKAFGIEGFGGSERSVNAYYRSGKDRGVSDGQSRGRVTVETRVRPPVTYKALLENLKLL